MELKSVFFANFISEIIGSTEMDKLSLKVVIATVPAIKSIPVVEKIKSLRNSQLFTVTKLNRNEIYDDIKTTITLWLCGSSSNKERV